VKKISKVSRVGLISPRRGLGKGRQAVRAGVEQVTLIPEEVRVMARQIGLERAKKIWELMLKGIQGTLPELSAYQWLESRHIEFEFQSPLLGGRGTHGGAIADFLISDLSPAGYYIWRIQGDFFHAGMGTAVIAKDDIQKARLRQMKIYGAPVLDVIDLWESRIYSDFPRVFLMAEAGQEMGPV